MDDIKKRQVEQWRKFEKKSKLNDLFKLSQRETHINSRFLENKKESYSSIYKNKSAPKKKIYEPIEVLSPMFGTMNRKEISNTFKAVKINRNNPKSKVSYKSVEAYLNKKIKDNKRDKVYSDFRDVSLFKNEKTNSNTSGDSIVNEDNDVLKNSSENKRPIFN